MKETHVDRRSLSEVAYGAMLVFVGGALGTTARVLLSELVPEYLGVPLGIFAVNVFGAFLLGWLVQVLSYSITRSSANLMLFLGTGTLGGFTTYSALAGDSAVLLQNGQALAGVTYALGTILLSLLASFLGIWVALLERRKRGSLGRDGSTNIQNISGPDSAQHSDGSSR